MNMSEIEEFVNSIYKYEDYREFLREYFDYQKRAKKSFTRRYFSEKAGFSSHSFCNYILSGKRNLSYKSLQKFIKGLELKGPKAKYFELLVLYNQSDSQDEIERYYNELDKIRKKVSFKGLDNRQSDYFKEKYHPIVRELAVHSNWDGDYTALAKMVRPSITTTQAKESVEMMLELEILNCVDGNYSFVDENIDGSNVPMFLKKKARREIFENAVISLDSMSPDMRYAACTTFSADEKTYLKINELYSKFKEEFIDLINNSEENSNVYQIVFGNIPVSK